jgi:methylenetetrahydrofolate dehydrogenase (NADP+)/methenyltetrahydrofolate cyclohydrolase
MLIDGRDIARDLKDTLRNELAELDRPAGIATLLVGDDLAAQVYQRRIDRNAHELGIASRPEQMPGDSTLGQVVGKIAELDADPDISGILVLRPLPPHLSESRIFNGLPVLKDVEAQHPTNAGLLSLGTPRFIPSTPAAAFYMLDAHLRSTGRDPETAYDGMDLVLVGRSNNVGKPAAILGLQRNATVISAHKHTADAGRLAEHTRQADFLIVAVGVSHLITGDMVKEGAIVVDIGINATEGPDGKVVLSGDVDAESVEPVAEAVSPVPGGVGPITDVWVLRNTVHAARLVERQIALA